MINLKEIKELFNNISKISANKRTKKDWDLYYLTIAELYNITIEIAKKIPLMDSDSGNTIWVNGKACAKIDVTGNS